MDVNTIPDRISTAIVLLIAILGIISSKIPDIQNMINSIPQQYQYPTFIVALILTAIIGIWSFWTSEKRNQDSYNLGLVTPVPEPKDNTETVNESDKA